MAVADAWLAGVVGQLPEFVGECEGPVVEPALPTGRVASSEVVGRSLVFDNAPRVSVVNAGRWRHEF